MIGKIRYASYGVKLNTQTFLLSHTDDTLLKTTPDINQTLLQFIDVINLVDLLLHFSPSVSSMISGANVCVWEFLWMCEIASI